MIEVRTLRSEPDDIVGRNAYVHLERMDKNSWNLIVSTDNGRDQIMLAITASSQVDVTALHDQGVIHWVDREV